MKFFKDTSKNARDMRVRCRGFSKSIAAVCAFAVLFSAIGVNPTSAAAAAKEIYQWNTGSETTGPIQASRYFIPSSAGLYLDEWTIPRYTVVEGGRVTSLLNDGSYSNGEDILFQGKKTQNWTGDGITFEPEKDNVIIEFDKAVVITELLAGASDAADFKFNWSQSVSKANISYWDNLNQKWVKALENCDGRLDSNDSANIEHKFYKRYTFNATEPTSKLRYELVNGATECGADIVGIAELIPYGKVVGEIQDGAESYTWNESADITGYIQGSYSAGFSADNEASTLNDGNYRENSYITFEQTNGVYDETQYIDIDFGNKIFDISSLLVGISKEHKDSSAVTGVRVDCRNPANGEWTEGDSFDIDVNDYVDYDAKVINKTAALVEFGKTYTTDAIRVWITGSSGTSVKVSELVPRGSFNGDNIGTALLPSVSVGFALDEWASTPDCLTDGNYGGNYVAYGSGEALGSNRTHIKMYFDGKKTEITALEIGSWRDRPNQWISEISIEYFDADYSKWISNKTYSVSNYANTKDDNAVKSVVMFDSPIVTTRLKVNLLASTGSVPIITECMPFGKTLDEKESNLAQQATVTVTSGRAENLTDCTLSGGVSVDITGDNAVSSENPYSVVFDFGTDYKNIANFEIFSKEAVSEGITSLVVYYQKNSQWTQTAEFDFTYSEGRASENLGIAEGDIDVTANKLRFDVVGVPSGADTLTINEICLYEKDISDLSELEKTIRMFKFTGKYNYYTAANSLISSYTGADKAELTDEIDEIVKSQLGLEKMEFSYDVVTSTVTVKGYAFKPQGDITLVFASEVYPEYTAAAAVDENGIVDSSINIESYKDGGTTTVSVNLVSGVKSGSFTARVPKSGKTLNSFSVDGASASISGNTVTLVLPAGSSLNGRTPFFSVSDGATLKYKNTVLESGKSVVDLINGEKLIVFAEDAENKTEYTLKVSVKKSDTSGGTGGSGSSGGSGTVYVPTERGDENQTEKSIFNDVPTDYWGYRAIKDLCDRGIINGKTNEMFEPEAMVTRGEFVKMAVVFLGIEPEISNDTFTDTDGHWAQKYVCAAVRAGIVNGKPDNSFGVDDAISRQDMAVVICRALDLKIQNEYDDRFSDSKEIAAYAVGAVNALSQLGYINGYDDNSYKPDAPLTRAEAAAVLARIK